MYTDVMNEAWYGILEHVGIFCNASADRRELGFRKSISANCKVNVAMVTKQGP